MNKNRQSFRRTPRARGKLPVVMTDELKQLIEEQKKEAAEYNRGSVMTKILQDPQVYVRDDRTEEEKFDDKYKIAPPTIVWMFGCAKIYEDATLGMYESSSLPTMGGGGGYDHGPSISLEGGEEPEKEG